MNELYTITHAAAIFGVPAARLRFWIQRGALTPSVRRGGRFLYTFADLIQVKVAVALFNRGVESDRIRTTLVTLREQIPPGLADEQLVKVTCQGDEFAVSLAGQSAPGPILCAFSSATLKEQIEAASESAGADGKPLTPEVVLDGPTQPHQQPTAYQCFARACESEEAGNLEQAEVFYERCLALEESFAAARTNLGNIHCRRGNVDAARRSYEAALEYEPEQAEARYNLGNLLDDAGETEQAIAELRRVVTRSPEFADAHFNLGVILARVGGFTQAKKHFSQYLELDESSSWAARAKQILETLKMTQVATA